MSAGSNGTDRALAWVAGAAIALLLLAVFAAYRPAHEPAPISGAQAA